MLSQYADMIRQSVAADNPDDDDDDDLHDDDEAADLAYSIKDIAQLIGSPSEDSEEETEPAAAHTTMMLIRMEDGMAASPSRASRAATR